MCGIVGWVGRGSSPSLHQISRAQEAIGHRGPDDSGIYQHPDQSVFLGHARLSILDPSEAGHQPMKDREGRTVIVFNGEIYNFWQLRSDLESLGYRFRSDSDTEVLLALYQAEGLSCLERLNGIFALAIWDEKKQSLFLARDGFGVKPLYFLQQENSFAFGSEIKALIPFIETMPEVDARALNGYLTHLWNPAISTPLKEVCKVRPGEAMIVREGRVENYWQWYRLPTVLRGHATQTRQRTTIDQTTSYLRRAVHRQLVSDVPVGAFLSGGLDSSAVVAMASEKILDLQCFTIEVDGGQERGSTEDLPYAKQVAKHLGVELSVVRVKSSQMAADLEKMIYQLDEPLADPAALNVLYISRLARESGIKVLLSGAGGDDVFSGYRRHRAVMAEKWWDWLPRSTREWLADATGSLNQSRPFFRRVAKLFNGAGLEEDERLVNYFRWIPRKDLEALYTKNFRDALGASRSEEPLLEFLREVPENKGKLDRLLALEQRFFLTEHNLTYTDKMSMAAGVEVRVPFLDLDLVEFAASLPENFKQRGKEGKWVLKKAMEPYLPRGVIYRPKSGFGAPLRRWIKEELRELVGDLLSAESLKRRGLFEPDAVHKLIQRNQAGEIDASYTIFSLMAIEIWCRRFLDGPRSSEGMN